MVALIVTMTEGVILQRLQGFDIGHDELLAAIDRWLSGLDARATASAASAPRRRKR